MSSPYLNFGLYAATAMFVLVLAFAPVSIQAEGDKTSGKSEVCKEHIKNEPEV